jgi:hypothetical protein
MGALRPTLRFWILAVLGASCGTAGSLEPGAAGATPRGPICGVDDKMLRALGMRADKLRPSELVLRVVNHADDQPLPSLALSLKGGNEVFGALECTARTDRFGVARVVVMDSLYKVAVAERRDLVARTSAIYSSGVEPKEIRIEKPGVISGRVLDERGKPMPRVNIVISGEDGLCGGLTDAAGGFRCEDLWSGEHSITASIEDRAAASRTVTLAPGQDLRGVDLTALPGGVLIVRATCGGPCVGATVSASIGDEIREERVGADGIARLRDLPSGEVKIYGFRDDPRGGRLRAKALGVMVQAGRTVNATLDLGRKRN